MPNSFLPPLPPSDDKSLQTNYWDGFYKQRARNFWGENQIEKIEDLHMEKCQHEFSYRNGGVECDKCHFGLSGPSLEIRSKKLFIRGEPVNGL